MNYKELKCERPYKRATIELDAKELWLLTRMFHEAEKSDKYRDNEEFKNLRKEFFLLYNIVNDGHIGEWTLEILAKMVSNADLKEGKDEENEQV